VETRRIDLSTREIPSADQIRDGEELRNINSFEYLANIAPYIPESLIDGGQDAIFFLVKDICGEGQSYQKDFPYGNLYTAFLKRLDDKFGKNPLREKVLNGRLSDDMKEMLNLIYANPNRGLERAGEFIEDITSKVQQTSRKIETQVRGKLIGIRDDDTIKEMIIKKFKFNLNITRGSKTTPQEEGSNFMLLKGLFQRNYKPLFSTGQPSVRKYEHQQAEDIKEYRFGTQGQRYKGNPRVSPLFEAWLSIQPRKAESDISHVYFNNLGLDRPDTLDVPGVKEAALSLQLQALEDGHKNVAVITLPADKGIMAHNLLKAHNKRHSYGDAKNYMCNLVTGKSKAKFKDFHISDRIKKLIYGEKDGKYDAAHEEEIINELLDKSFKKMGFSENQQLSDAELQAVYFHFIKFELTQFILAKLKPNSFNMSCKDAIDRGGVSSAYYNLILSIERNKPMSAKEFDRAMHAAPTIVKGRGMNDHSQRIWNAINVYINGQDEADPENNIPHWLRDWRLKHAPRFSRLHCLAKIQKYIDEITKEGNKPDLSSSQKKIKRTKLEAARKMLQLINGEVETVQFTVDEKKAMGNARLGKIYNGLKNTDIILPEVKVESGYDSDEDMNSESLLMPGQIMSFSQRAEIVKPVEGETLDEAIERHLKNARVPTKVAGKISNKSDKVLDVFLPDQAKINFSTIKTSGFFSSAKAEVVSVQRMRDRRYVSEFHFDPKELNRFGEKGYLRWAVSEIENFREKNS